VVNFLAIISLYVVNFYVSEHSIDAILEKNG